MTIFTKFTQSVSDLVLLIVRLVTGYMFLLHGTAKFFELPVSMTGGNGAVELFSLMGVGGVLEIVGGLLIAVGLLTRPMAFLLAGMMAVAYFVFHAAAGAVFDPISNHGEAAALFSMVFLLLWIVGAGKFSVDAKLGK